MTTTTNTETGFIQTKEQLDVKAFAMREALEIYNQRVKTLVDGVFRVCPLAYQYSLLITYNVDASKIEFKIFHGQSFEEIKDISLLPVDVAMAYVEYRREYELEGNLPESNSILTAQFLKVMQTKYSESLNG